MYLTETDIAVGGRGLPLVFERTYNSLDAMQPDSESAPLGHGWTHSFNHYLLFEDDDFDPESEDTDEDGRTSVVTLVTGDGGKRFIEVSGNASGVDVGSVFTAPEGYYFSVERNGEGYQVTEKNGLTYTFEDVAGTVGQKARLLRIEDRRGNSLTLTYDGEDLESVADDLGRTLDFSYDASHRIIEITDWAGRQYQYTYNAEGELEDVFNPLAVAGDQQPEHYEYYGAESGENLKHAMRSYTHPRGNGMTFEYYMNGRVFRHSNSLGETMKFSYNDFRRESTLVDERGNAYKYFFDKHGNLTASINENGGRTEYTYDPDNPFNRISEKNPMGYVTEYQYDSDGNVIQVTSPSGNTVEYSDFNEYSQVGKIKGVDGIYTLLKYDAEGNLLQSLRLKRGYGDTVDPQTYTPVPSELLSWTTHQYDEHGNRIETKRIRDFANEVGPTVTYTYDGDDLYPTEITRCGDKDGDGDIGDDACDTASLTYDSLGRLTHGVDGNWEVVEYIYNDLGQLVRGTDATGRMRDYEYDHNGNPVSEILKVGNRRVDQNAISYDLADRVSRVIDSGGFVTSYQYDARGNAIAVTNPDGYKIGFEYDPANRMIKAFDQEGHTVTRDLDLIGRLRSTTDPNGNKTTYYYYGPEQDGRLKMQVDPLGRETHYEYDVSGNVTKLTDHLGRVTRMEYDDLNRVVRVVEPLYADTVLGNAQSVTQYSYDNLGNLIETRAGYNLNGGENSADDDVAIQSSVTYDDFGRKLTDTDAHGKSHTFEYDLHNNLVRIEDPKGQIVVLSYGYGGSLDTQTVYKSATDENPHITQFTRNELGQTLEVTSPEATYAYTYDSAHRPVTVEDKRANKRLRYAYSPGGSLISMKDSEGNRTDYLYDAVGRLSGIWAPNGEYTGYQYDAGGRLKEKRMPNGTKSQYYYNVDDSLSSLVNRKGDDIISQHDYTYDEIGNRKTYTEHISLNVKKFQYDYDNMDRLASVRDITAGGNILVQAVTYDPFGNRRTLTDENGTIDYVYATGDPVQLKEIQKDGATLTSYNYDDNGNLIQITGSETLTLTYDALDRLEQVEKAGQPTEQYKYDTQGRRIQKQVGDSITNYLYNGPDIHAEYGESWSKAAFLYTHGPAIDDPLMQVDNSGNAVYFHQDALGSVAAATDLQGDILGSARYDSWGNTTEAIGTIPRFGYTGREPDATGLIYYRARYYDPQIGRFTQRDPKGFVDGINRYAYAINSPVNFIDPWGTDSFGSIFRNAARQYVSYVKNYADFSIGYGKGAVDSTLKMSWEMPLIPTAFYFPSYADLTGIEYSSLFSKPQSNIGQLGYDLGPTAPVLASAAGRNPMGVLRSLPGRARGLLGRFFGSKIRGVQANRIQGKAGEAITEKTLKQSGIYAGRQVTFETSTGKRSVIDFVTNVRGGKGVKETKTGNGQLSSGQAQLFDDVINKRPVIPRGQNAVKAGLTPGKPIVLKCCGIDRPF
jgi:RHS repeat-associated protein